jgi:Fe-S-cluster-containing dehydrogenase component
MSDKKKDTHDFEVTERRTFLKVAGASVIGAAAIPAVVARGSGGEEKPQGKQWAMVIDVARCLRDEGCTKCIDACNREHNVPDVSGRVPPEMRKKRVVKWIWKQGYEGAFPEQEHEFLERKLAGKELPVLCNHCADAPCVRVCPTQATWKRESDGIVMMDMHRCIGCRYCIVGCPYGSRSFNWIDPWPRPFEEHGFPPNMKYPTRTKGVVEKCTFCAERLAESQRTGGPFIPACVEACPAKAMIFGDVNEEGSEVRKVLEARHSIRRKPGLGTRPQIYYLV